MTKERLKNKLIGFQTEIVELGQTLQAERKISEDQQERLFLELFAVLDACENIFNNMAEKEETLDKSSRRMLKSFRAVYRKLLRLLEEQGVERIEFPDGKSAIGLCKVLETRPVAEREEGEIITVVRSGYRSKKRILRPAEVITVRSLEAT
jgi:molecular chaperone GrpE (heat shock protein)